jgi:hypothetical protein
MNIKSVDIAQIKTNPNNPRIIKDDKYAKLVESIRTFPKMLEIRPIVVNADMIVLGGNMRLRACKEAGIKKIPVIMAEDLTPEQQREFIIKDNVGFGEWDWEMLANEWESEELDRWGVDTPGFNGVEDLGEEFTLPDGDKQPFQQMTFTLADKQAEQVKDAMAQIRQTDEFDYVETFGNENGNGNALYLIVMQWAEQRK